MDDTYISVSEMAKLHAYGDIYASVEYRVPEAGTAELVFTSKNGEVTRKTIHV